MSRPARQTNRSVLNTSIGFDTNIGALVRRYTRRQVVGAQRSLGCGWEDRLMSRHRLRIGLADKFPSKFHTPESQDTLHRTNKAVARSGLPCRFRRFCIRRHPGRGLQAHMRRFLRLSHRIVRKGSLGPQYIAARNFHTFFPSQLGKTHRFRTHPCRADTRGDRFRHRRNRTGIRRRQHRVWASTFP